MNQQDFEATVRRYAAELMKLAKRRTPAENLPAAAPGPEKPADPPGMEFQIERESGDDARWDDAAAETYAEFSEASQFTGRLRVQAEAGRCGFPVAGVQIVVRKTFADGIIVFATAETDESGIADGIFLPAPARAASQRPAQTAPYAAYEVVVTHPDYRKETYPRVPVFAGVKSIRFGLQYVLHGVPAALALFRVLAIRQYACIRAPRESRPALVSCGARLGARLERGALPTAAPTPAPFFRHRRRSQALRAKSST